MAKNSSNSLIKAGMVILISNSIFNVANFVYHIMAARMLGPAEYSIVASIFSIFYLISVGSAAIQNTTTKFIANYKAKKEDNKILYFLRRGRRKISLISVLIFMAYVMISPLIAGFLKISVVAVLISSPIIIMFLLLSFNRGILQGLQKFNSLGINLIVEGITRLILALILISIGFKSNGAIAAVLITSAFALIITFPAIKLEKSKVAKSSKLLDKKGIYNFALISFIALFFINVIYNVDIFLVKHFFSAEAAGHYAALSLLGKIVFFIAISIGMVMFPKISELESRKKDSKPIFQKSMFYTFITSAAVIAIYFLFSKTIISLIFGEAYLDVSGLLWEFGLFMALVSLSYICVLHKLAIGKKKFIWNLAIAVLAEIMAICLFHSTIAQVVTSLIVLNSILFISLLKE